MLSGRLKRDQDKISELKHDLVKLSRREEKIQQELAEQRKSAETSAASAAAKLKAAQKEKAELDSALDQVTAIAYAMLVTINVAELSFCHGLRPVSKTLIFLIIVIVRHLKKITCRQSVLTHTNVFLKFTCHTSQLPAWSRQLVSGVLHICGQSYCYC